MEKEGAKIVNTGVLIIGGGGAGLRAAIEARKYGAEVLIVSQSRIGYGSNTSIAGGGFAAVAGQEPQDSCNQHLEDVLSGGYKMGNPKLIKTMVEEAGQQAMDLKQFGVRYTSKRESPWIALSMEPGHFYNRTIYSENAFGTDFTFPLRQHTQKQGVKFIEGILITALLNRGNRIVGAIGMDLNGQLFVFLAAAVILATGGSGQLYLRTDNTAGSTGDGYALAYDAGAELLDMEFVQFYPIALGSGTPSAFYECFLLDGGGRLLNSRGEDILAKHSLDCPMILTRDRVSQAVFKEITNGFGLEDKVILDLNKVTAENMEILRPMLPKVVLRGERQCLVSPMAHFQMGGVRINEKAETCIAGLYAAGEICAGVHGANRLTGNALTELWVFGTVAGREAALSASKAKREPLPRDLLIEAIKGLNNAGSGGNSETVEGLQQSLRESMWQKAGIIRDSGDLLKCLDEIDILKARYKNLSVPDGRLKVRALKLGNMLKVAEMVCRAALERKESRGAHYRQDFPEQDNDWLCNLIIRKRGEEIALRPEPVL